MALTAQHVVKQFMRKRKGDSNVFCAVNDVSVELPGGEVIVITGPSGSGKSTLLNMMAGIMTPTEGTIRIGETDLYSLGDEELSSFRNQHIGVIPQGQTPVYSLSVLENVLLPYDFSGKKKTGKRTGGKEKKPSGKTAEGSAAQTEKADSAARAEMKEEPEDRQRQTALNDQTARKRALELLKRMGIEDLKDTMPSELSGGELRRVSIARAMLMKPDVILADEPSSDLDEKNTEVVLEMMKFAAKQEGSAVMIVTHDKDVFPWADKVFSLRDGRLGEGS